MTEDTKRKYTLKRSPTGLPCPLTGDFESYGWKLHILDGVQVHISNRAYLHLRRQVYSARRTEKRRNDAEYREAENAKTRSLSPEKKHARNERLRARRDQSRLLGKPVNKKRSGTTIGGPCELCGVTESRVFRKSGSLEKLVCNSCYRRQERESGVAQARQRKWYALNKEHVLEYNKQQRRDLTPEQSAARRETKRVWREDNAESIAIAKKAHRNSHLEEYKAKEKERHIRNKDRILSKMKEGAASRTSDQPGEHPEDEAETTPPLTSKVPDFSHLEEI